MAPFTFPPLAYWGLDGAFEAVEHVVDDVYTSRNETSAQLHEGEWNAGDPEGAYLDACVRYVFQEAACSCVLVGALAPFVETLIRRAAAKLQERASLRSISNTHLRWRLFEKADGREEVLESVSRFSTLSDR